MEETDEERRRRKNREKSARWYAANPERARKAKRDARARWLADVSESDPERLSSLRKKWNEMGARWVSENRGRALLNACRRSAKGRGHDCSLTIDDVEALVSPMRCSATGVPLSWEWEGPDRNPWAPSIDRLDCSRGYEPGNVRLVCWAFNQARGSWPDSVVTAWAESLAGARARAQSSPTGAA